MIKLIAFDLDGTLGDTLPLCVDALKKAINPYAPERITDSSIECYFGINEEGIIKRLAGEQWEQSLEDFIRIYQAMHHMCAQPFEGIVDLLQNIKDRGIPLALITGKGKRSCDISLVEFGIDHFFEVVETGGEDKNTKAESLRFLLDTYQIAPEEMVYIGDTDSDITACQKAGVPCLSVTWASSTDDEYIRALNPDHTFDQVEDLQQFILNRLN